MKEKLSTNVVDQLSSNKRFRMQLLHSQFAVQHCAWQKIGVSYAILPKITVAMGKVKAAVENLLSLNFIIRNSKSKTRP